MPSPSRLTIDQTLEFLIPDWRRRFRPNWPPDVFAVSAALLQKSGSYARVVMGDWPPRGSGRVWKTRIRKIAKAWRSKASAGRTAPAEVKKWWSKVASRAGIAVLDISTDNELVESLLQLLAASDETSAGLGLPTRRADAMEFLAQELLEPSRRGGSTLCKLIDGSRCRVFPKMHTTQRGLTIRSLSHHLALCWTADVEPRWFLSPTSGFSKRLNLLLLPWPLSVVPRQFAPAKPSRGPLRNMAKGYGFFNFEPADAKSLPDLLTEVVQTAQHTVGPIDGVILPELSVRESQFARISSVALHHTNFVVCGVKGSGAGPFATNEVRFRTKLWRGAVAGPPSGVFVEIDSQPKHHRWLLDGNQIVQYGLGGTLDPSDSWWENIEIGDRHLNFVALEDWLAACVLICEDLARQDPVAEIVRAIGPNLVVALLMDGPQLSSRWPARYATVLADDPGSSVLTLTSLGMAALSRPPGREVARVIGLWKDAQRAEPVEINLPKDHHAVVLSLSVRYQEEFTADGRSDRGKTGSVTLSGVHPIAASTSLT